MIFNNCTCETVGTMKRLNITKKKIITISDFMVGATDNVDIGGQESA